MRGVIRFFLAFLFASIAATLVVGILYWLFQSPETPADIASYKYAFTLLLAVWLGVTAIASLPALGALGLSLLMRSKWRTWFLVATGLLTGETAFLAMNLAHGSDRSILRTGLEVFGLWPGHLIFALAGAAGGWVFARVWATSGKAYLSTASEAK